MSAIPPVFIFPPIRLPPPPPFFGLSLQTNHLQQSIQGSRMGHPRATLGSRLGHPIPRAPDMRAIFARGGMESQGLPPRSRFLRPGGMESQPQIGRGLQPPKNTNATESPLRHLLPTFAPSGLMLVCEPLHVCRPSTHPNHYSKQITKRQQRVSPAHGLLHKCGY